MTIWLENELTENYHCNLCLYVVYSDFSNAYWNPWQTVYQIELHENQLLWIVTTWTQNDMHENQLLHNKV
jgi:hypothetical protein